LHNPDGEAERAVLVGLDAGDGSAARSMAELAELVRTAGGMASVVSVQPRSSPHAATYVGKGKVAEIGLIIDSEDLDIAVTNDPLSPRQQRALEREWGVPVIDRTEVILDIFAQRARSREGKLQVELAQLEYLLPRLTGRGEVLSRLGGGIGTRGPGETQLEVDRRRIRARVTRLRDSIREVRGRRQVERQSREEQGRFTAALVGYTNAGKSTLLNALAGADAYVDDLLFATLDPTTRAVETPDGLRILLTDTVGFIEKLPHNLVAAFAATLEEATAAQLLLHVVDASDPAAADKIEAVYAVLEELGVLDRPSLLLLNKADATTPEQLAELPEGENVLQVSALTGAGFDDLRQALAERASTTLRVVRLVVPFTEMDRLNELRRRGRLVEERYEADGVHVVAEVPRDVAGRLEALAVGVKAR